jgi:hypothetical protein
MDPQGVGRQPFIHRFRGTRATRLIPVMVIPAAQATGRQRGDGR